jgi:hypothetical protein
MAGGTPANPATPVHRPSPRLSANRIHGTGALQNIDEFVLTLIVTVLYEMPGMTSAQIAKVASNRTARRIDRRGVETILTSIAGGVVSVAGVPLSQVVCQRRRGLFQRGTRWRLVAAPASPPDTSGAPVPASPYPRSSSGAAAAMLTFRQDEPPTNAIGKPA